jgi:cell division septum initiation protein DivIVA
MATLGPEDLNISALPRNRFGQLKEDAASEFLQRAAWNYRQALSEKQRLARMVDELTEQVDELREHVSTLETEAARQKEPDELARVLLASARGTAREERQAARRECELMLKKAIRRSQQIEEWAARRAAERAESDALRGERRKRELTSAQVEANAALADAQRELKRLETETAMLRSLRSEAEQQVAAVLQGTLEELESLRVAVDGGGDDLLSDLQLGG